MNEWREVKLGDIIDIIGGGTPKTSNAEYWNGDIPWLSVVDFNNGRKKVYKTEKSITQLGLDNSSAKLLEKGDIIISARGTVGVISMLGRKMAFNQSCYGIKSKDLSINEYLFYLLKYHVPKLLQYSHGGVFDTITRDTFDEININLPPLSEQKAIASVLSSLDDKIDLLHRQNETLEKMAETLFRQWFVEEADDSWEEGVLGEEFDFTMGQSPPGISFNEEGLGIPMYQGNRDFGLRFPNRRIYTTDPKRYANKYDTLISVRAPVGAQNMAKEKCCIGRGVAAFRYKKNHNYYTYTYFKLKSLMSEIKQFNNEGTVFGSISKSDFQKMEIIIPDNSAVESFQEKAKPIDDKIIINSKQIQTLENLRDTLLPRLMSGEVRVK
ncbi:restriction endonuclease subunit S [Ornithobacterium rhinotracheale]